MNILINASNLHIGGALQVAISIIEEVQYFDNNHRFIIVCSSEVLSSIVISSYDNRFTFYSIDSVGLPMFRFANKELNRIVSKEKVDVVFSVFGPTYWTPKVPHIMGFAIPELINPESKVFKLYSWRKRLKVKLKLMVLAFYIKRNASVYWTETEDCKRRMHKYLVDEKRNVHVIGNTFSRYYNEVESSNSTILPEKPFGSVRFITISANYFHKNLSIIRDVSLGLDKIGLKHEFIVTIEKDDFERLFHGINNVKTLGKVSPAICPQLYNESDFVFLPTLLECFSANYPEAMVMKKPILTSNYSFARDLCKKAAVYFDPLDKEDILNAILKVVKDRELQNQLVNEGLKRLKDFPSARERAESVLKLCEEYGYEK